jgi:hypothetical protein
VAVGYSGGRIILALVKLIAGIEGYKIGFYGSGYGVVYRVSCKAGIIN